jgi:hypothetical protein
MIKSALIIEWIKIEYVKQKNNAQISGLESYLTTAMWLT